MKKVWRTVKPALYVASFVLLLVAVVWLYRANYIPHARYTGEHFGISPYISLVDCDGDGIDDQSDILQSAKDYVSTEPLYKSKYYATGYPDDGYGVCTDVVAFALKGAGYDLMELVNQDILENPKDYQIEKPDINIDFRRVVNLQVYFSHTALSLTTDPEEIDQWQGGDIVVWEHHVGVISDVRNRNGVPFVLHNGSLIQASYEEDILETYGKIVGHYRVNSL